MQTIEIILNVLYIAILITVSYTDLRWRIIPNRIIVPSIVLASVASFFEPNWLEALSGGLVAATFFAIPLFVYGPKQAGGGDVKLASFIGFALAWPNVVYAISIAAFVALVVMVPSLLLRRSNRNTTIPFAPFLALGAIILLWIRITSSL